MGRGARGWCPSVGQASGSKLFTVPEYGEVVRSGTEAGSVRADSVARARAASTDLTR